MRPRGLIPRFERRCSGCPTNTPYWLQLDGNRLTFVEQLELDTMAIYANRAEGCGTQDAKKNLVTRIAGNAPMSVPPFRNPSTDCVISRLKMRQQEMKGNFSAFACRQTNGDQFCSQQRVIGK